MAGERADGGGGERGGFGTHGVRWTCYVWACVWVIFGFRGVCGGSGKGWLGGVVGWFKNA